MISQNLINGLQILRDYDETSGMWNENDLVVVEVWTKKLTHGDVVALRELGWVLSENYAKFLL